jgi:mono/diheme cytochrome c family protein
MDEKRYTHRVQWLVLTGSALLFLLLIGVWVHEGLGREWRKQQKAYGRILQEMSSGGEEPGSGDFERGIFQAGLPQFNRVDRCISCHNGIEDKRMTGLPQPHAAHPGEFLEDHPVREYGCTICHGGQGRALTRKDAFGRLPGTHWPYPLLEQPYIQASCGKCHLAIFNNPGFEEMEAISGMEVFLRGKTLFSQEGCLGCHKARGTGGILGPDLTRQGEKTKHEYSFQNVAGEQTVSNWLKEHFKDPEMVSPGSQMLRINLEEEELEALATFVMGLSKPEIPFDYFTMPTLNEFKGIREAMEGSAGFARLCSACHGKQGEGKNYKTYKTGTPRIGGVDFLRVASEDFIRFTLEKGRSLRQMGSWAGSVSGMKGEELDSITAHLKGRGGGPAVTGLIRISGNADLGGRLFNDLCRACHGENGEGDVAVALNQPGFLDRASDLFILRTMLNGRVNTAMPGWSHLGDADLVNLLAAIRSWKGSLSRRGEMALPEADLEEGELRYHFLCSRCHGEFGEGETGPAIINRDFLEAAGNSYLYETIAEGRAHTAMFGWSLDVYNKEKLGLRDISNIIGYMRAASVSRLTYIFPGSNPGERELGAGIFAARCAECHGAGGEGKAAPALNNQEFLSAASNGFLMATITVGRNGTAMPSWGYGQGEYKALPGMERQHLVAFIRAWQRIRIKY